MNEFKKFILKGNVIDMAVGIIIGLAFGAIVNSIVSDILMPPVGLLLGRADFTNLYAVLREGVVPPPYVSLEAAREAGAVTLNYGLFVNSVISFLVIALVLFFVIKAINRLRRKQEEKPPPQTKKCPYCFSDIALKATRCPNCTSQVEAA